MKQQLPRDEYLRSLATKRTGVGVLFFDESGKVLIVKPNYREGWQVPGGSVDKNESPKEAGIRETKEEIGITIDDLTFLSVEYKKVLDFDFLEFIFLGKVLSAEDIASITIQKDELDEFRFVTEEEALLLFRESWKKRFPIALEVMKTGKPVYFINER
jgi:8-oxo-dGTP pyrophosphatase MutT (NUDIX family)